MKCAHELCRASQGQEVKRYATQQTMPKQVGIHNSKSVLRQAMPNFGSFGNSKLTNGDGIWKSGLVGDILNIYCNTGCSQCLDLNEARCSGISWTIYKQSAPQITKPTPHH